MVSDVVDLDERVPAAGAVVRWVPDELLVASVLGSPRSWRGATELSSADRAWLVAGLSLGGLTAADIASRLSCSLRLVRSIRAEDVTQVCVWAQRQARVLGDGVRVERVAHAGTRLELVRARAEVVRLKAQVEDLLSALVAGGVDCCRKGHPLVGYNVYKSGGKTYCRECRREWDALHRSRSRRVSA
jgi:hypothetical protein